jgi:hypothetical protein
MWLCNGSWFQAAEDMLDHSNDKHLDHEEAMVQEFPE